MTENQNAIVKQVERYARLHARLHAREPLAKDNIMNLLAVVKELDLFNEKAIGLATDSRRREDNAVIKIDELICKKNALEEENKDLSKLIDKIDKLWKTAEAENKDMEKTIERAEKLYVSAHIDNSNCVGREMALEAKVKELETDRDVLTNCLTELTHEEITGDDIRNILKQTGSLDSDIARIATLETENKELKEKAEKWAGQWQKTNGLLGEERFDRHDAEAKLKDAHNIARHLVDSGITCVYRRGGILESSKWLNGTLNQLLKLLSEEQTEKTTVGAAITVTSKDEGAFINPKIYKTSWMRDDEIFVVQAGQEHIIHEMNRLYEELKDRGSIIKIDAEKMTAEPLNQAEDKTE